MALPELFANDVTTTLAADITTTGATSITVASSTGFPAAATAGGQFRVRIGNEYMIVTNVSGTTWTVTRGAESSTAATHSSGATVSHVLTAGGATALRGIDVNSAVLVSRGNNDSDSTLGFQNVGQAFTTLQLSVEEYDPGNNYDPATYIYTVPATGLYQITGTVRPAGSTPVDTNFGIGVHTSNIDGAWFLWHSMQNNVAGPSTPGARRTTYPYVRIARFTVGDLLRMYMYLDDSTARPIYRASMQIVRLA